MVSDTAVVKPVLQGLWNANGILLMAQIHFKTRRQNITCYPGSVAVFVGHRFHVYKFEPTGTLTFCDAEWFCL
jgi:hypothetical protein